MMGVGKSTVGQLLANRTGRAFLDTDRMLVQRFGRPIPQIFQLYGEATFRDHETSILKSIERDGQVISTGGGIVIRPENWLLMRALGTVIFLDVPLDILIDRLRASKKRRPLLQAENFEERVETILSSRRTVYEQADVHVHLGDLMSEPATDLILQKLSEAGVQS